MPEIECTCLQCGNIFYYRTSKNKNHVRKYCSRECYSKSHRIERMCLYCGKMFHVVKSIANAGYGVYCSNECQKKGSAKNRCGTKHAKYVNRVKKECETCGKIFYVRETSGKANRFCSLSCYHISKKGQRPHNYKRIEKTCVCCGKKFMAKSYYIKNGGGKYCSRECQYKHMVGKNSGGYQGGLSFEPYCEKFNENFKDRVRYFFNNVCFICGKPEDKIKLSVHHVNYDKMVCCNDVMPLFVPLCKKCHPKTNHNREHWEKYFTDRLMDEYNGECYLPVV